MLIVNWFEKTGARASRRLLRSAIEPGPAALRGPAHGGMPANHLRAARFGLEHGGRQIIFNTWQSEASDVNAAGFFAADVDADGSEDLVGGKSFRSIFRTSAMLLIVLLTTATDSRGDDLKMASIFTDHMILQRERPVAIWGTSILVMS